MFKDKAALLALLTPAALLGGAYISQYGFGLYPCEMCWWQRYAHFAALALAVLALMLRGNRVLVALAAVAIAASGLIGLFHAGVEYGWWKGFTACTASPLASGGNPLDAIMNAPMVRCDVPQWTLFGVSLAGFNFVFSVGGALLVFSLLRRPAGVRA
jgi:disulfide bond formation protein DsbB